MAPGASPSRPAIKGRGEQVAAGVCAESAPARPPARAPAGSPFARAAALAADRSTAAPRIFDSNATGLLACRSPVGREACLSERRAALRPTMASAEGPASVRLSGIGPPSSRRTSRLLTTARTTPIPKQSTWRSAAGWLGSTVRGLARHRTTAVTGLHHRPPRLRQARGRQVPRATRRLARNRRGAGHR